MLLAIDLGNSHMSLGVFAGEKLRLRAKVSTVRERSADEYAILLDSLLRVNGVDRQALDGCMMASVVPTVTGLVEEGVRILTGLPVMKIGPGIRTGFRIHIDDPSQLGADLVADTAAALAEYGAPLILLDAGTVTTIAAVDEHRAYQGGCIMPGLYGSAELLKTSTALLPAIALEKTGESILGKNSADAMRNGLLLGNAMMVDGFIRSFRALPGMEGAKAVATGGSAQLITAGCASPVILDEDLTLKGLRILYQLNTVKRF